MSGLPVHFLKTGPGDPSVSVAQQPIPWAEAMSRDGLPVQGTQLQAENEEKFSMSVTDKRESYESIEHL